MSIPAFVRKTIAIQVFVQGVLLVAAQQNPVNPKPLSATFSERLAFGKSMYVKNEHGSNIPFDVINADLQGWGRFVILDSAGNADFIAEVTSYEAGGVRLGGTTSYGTPDGKSWPTARKDLSSASVTLKISEAKTGREVWSGTEKVKSAVKKKAEDDNVVAASEKLFRRFHDAVESPNP